MSGEQPISFSGAPAFCGDGAESVSGGTNGSAPVSSAALMERHRVAMTIVDTLGEAERWALLEAVVWPSDVLEELQREAAA